LLTLIPGVGIAAGVLGSTFGRAFTVAAGAGIGAWIDSTLFSGEFDPTSPAAVRLRNQFADALVGFDEEVQNKLIQGLEELDKRYGALSTIDPRARVALRTQQQLLLASGEYLSNVEAVSQLMQVTGQQADVIAKIFDFAPVVDQMSYIQRVFNTLNNQKIDLTFIDVESLQKRVLEPSEEVTNFLNKQVGVFGELLTQIKLGAVEPTYLDQEQTLALQSANANLFTIQQRLKAAQTQATDTNKSILQVLGEGDALNQALVQIFSNINVKIEDVIKFDVIEDDGKFDKSKNQGGDVIINKSSVKIDGKNSYRIFEIDAPEEKFPKEKLIELAKRCAEEQEKYISKGDYET
jgi:hypothetical protein